MRSMVSPPAVAGMEINQRLENSAMNLLDLSTWDESRRRDGRLVTQMDEQARQRDHLCLRGRDERRHEREGVGRQHALSCGIRVSAAERHSTADRHRGMDIVRIGHLRGRRRSRGKI